MGCSPSVPGRQLAAQKPQDNEGAMPVHVATPTCEAPCATTSEHAWVNPMPNAPANAADPAPQANPPVPALMPLSGRAVHLRFLRKMAALTIKVEGEQRRFGEVPIYQAVNAFVRPRTLQGRKSFMEAVAACELSLPFLQLQPGGDSTAGHTPLVCEPSRCGQELMGRPPQVGDRSAWSEQVRKPQQTPPAHTASAACGPLACGPVTYFVSYTWSYTLDHLLTMVEEHYRSLPGTMVHRTGLTPTECYQPVFYWVDIFAVTQHFKGDFKDHPDSDFPGVIRASQVRQQELLGHCWRARQQGCITQPGDGRERPGALPVMQPVVLLGMWAMWAVPVQFGSTANMIGVCCSLSRPWSDPSTSPGYGASSRP
ncbi:hypothetical protein Agub_g11728 [Astrephomene gubernaculifera]|uniref:Uncharacterized protein n=1 Tax=Astrephomene gubernaculifera TaxID=47775 RepID=A0AAD3HRB9_9CHLO|nr:hypothetical protein Agub_g11728 [Astrephomene gubernaculifera]